MSERFQIDILDFGGWVRVFLARGEPMGATAEFLSQSLNGWMQSNPHLRVRIIVPVTSNGIRRNFMHGMTRFRFIAQFKVTDLNLWTDQHESLRSRTT